MEFKRNWAIVFNSDGLDRDWANEYLNSVPGTRVVDVKETELTSSNHETGEDEDIPVVVFVMETDGFLVPFKFLWELNLKSTEDNPLVYFPVEKES